VLGSCQKVLGFAAFGLVVMMGGRAEAQDLVSALNGKTVTLSFTMEARLAGHDPNPVKFQVTDRVRFHGDRILVDRIKQVQVGTPSDTRRSEDKGYAFVANRRIDALRDRMNKPFFYEKNTTNHYGYLTHATEGNTMTFKVETSSTYDVGKKDPDWIYYVNKDAVQSNLSIEFSNDLRTCRMARYQVDTSSYLRSARRRRGRGDTRCRAEREPPQRIRDS